MAYRFFDAQEGFPDPDEYHRLHRKAFRIPMNIIGVLIILSTMFIKQHSVLDVAAAFGLSYASYLAVFRYHAGSILLRGNAGKQEPLQGEYCKANKETRAAGRT